MDCLYLIMVTSIHRIEAKRLSREGFESFQFITSGKWPNDDNSPGPEQDHRWDVKNNHH